MITAPTLAELRAELARREFGVAGAQTKRLWAPLPGPQTVAYHSPADELYYGGAPGGGKSDLGLGLAVTEHQSSIIFRREFRMFAGPEGLIERSRQIIGDNGRLNESKYSWRDLPGNRSLEFGAVKNENDKFNYKGRAHDLKVFDELPDFTETQYRFLIAWLRTTVEGQRTRVVGTGNPPLTPEGQWVIRYWGPWLDEHHPHPAQPGELRWYATVGGKDVERPNGEPFLLGGRDICPHQFDARNQCTVCGGEIVKPRSRTFILARLEDNPLLLRTGYGDVLDNLPEPLRSQLRRADFGVTQEDHPWQVIPTAWVKAAQDRWRRTPKPATPLSALGCDPSRGGQDEFVIAPRHDAFVDTLVVHPATAAPDGQTGAALVSREALTRTRELVSERQPHPERSVPICIDIGGAAGSSVFDHVRELLLEAIALNGSERSEKRDKSGRLGFVNKRAEWHWTLREQIDPASKQDLALPPDTQLLSDLCAPRWRLTPRGIQVEEKEEIKKRIGRSPDRGEAVMYACVVGPDDLLRYLAASLPDRHGRPTATAHNFGYDQDDDEKDQDDDRPIF